MLIERKLNLGKGNYQISELIDIDSELNNRNRINSKAPSSKYPFCNTNQCMKGNGYYLSPHLDPLLCDRNYLVPTNIKKNISSGITNPNQNICRPMYSKN